MTLAIYNNLDSLPSPVNANEGDIAFVKETGETKQFLDLSTLSSFSYSFDGNSYLNVDSTSINHLSNNINDNFSISFFSYSVDSPSNSSLLSFYLDSNVSTIVDGSAVPASLNLSDSIGAFTFTPLETLNNPEANAASIYFPGVNSSITSSANQSLVNFTQEFLPYTIESWTKTLQTPLGSQTVTDIPGCLRWTNDGIITNDVKFKFQTPGNFTYDTWEHNALSYDGYDHKYFLNGTEIPMSMDANYEFSNGSLYLNQFETDKSATFQAKVFFPSTPVDATLFSLGNTGNQTSITLSNASTTPTLTLAKDGLSVSTTSVPTDSDYHVVSWIYDNDAGSIKLLLDNSVVGTDTSGSSFTNWADQGSAEYISEYPISAGDITYQPYHYHSSAANHEVLQDATTITSSGNIRMNTTRNNRWSYFVITGGDLITTAQNKIYYFESKWIGNPIPTTRATDPYPYTNSGVFIVDAGWDGLPTSPNNTEYTIESWQGEYLRNSNLRPSASNNGIYLSPLLYSTNGYGRHDNGKIYSYFIDTRNNKLICFRDGRYILRHMALAFGGGSAPVAGSGFKIAIQNWNNDRYNTKPYDPNANVEFVFNKNDWAFDPMDIYRTYSSNLSITIPEDGAFLSSSNFQNWPQETNSWPYKLRYYPKKVEKLETKSITLGTGEKQLNTENETGTSYANAYIANTGGSIVSHSDSDLTSLISSASISSGDALLLDSGTYSLNAIQDPTYGNSGNGTFNLFGGKSILICGKTSNPNDVIINYTPTNNHRDKPLFGRTQSPNSGISFVRFKRKFVGGGITNYIMAISNFSNGFTCHKTIFDFDNKKFSFSYDNSYKPGKKIFNECIFTNYDGEVFPDYRGDPSSIVINNCTFTDDYDENNSFRHTKKGLIEKDVKISNTNLSLTKKNFKGYMKNFHVRSITAYDSDFTINDSTQRSPIFSSNTQGVNTELLVKSTGESPTILEVTTSGNLLHNNNRVYSGSIGKQDWTYHRIKIDNNNLEYYNDSSLLHTINNFLVPEKTVSDMEVLIGNKKVFQSSTGSFIDDPVEQDTIIKDFRLADSIGTSIPNANHTRVSEDRVLTADNSTVPSNTDVNVIGSGITATNFSPVAGQNKNWFTISKEPVNISLNSQQNIVNFNDKGPGPDYDVIENTYDSNLTLFDSGNDYRIQILLQNTDDSNQPIEWNYKAIQFRKRVDIGYDSTNTNYLIKKHRNAGILDHYDSQGDYEAFISFYPQKVNSNDSSEPLFFSEPGSSIKAPISSINILCDKIGVNIDQSSPFDYNIATLSELDSLATEVGYTFDSEFTDFAIYDSLGALP